MPSRFVETPTPKRLSDTDVDWILDRIIGPYFKERREKGCASIKGATSKRMKKSAGP